LNALTRLPVVMLKAKMSLAVTSPAPPVGTPGGRALVKLPVT